MRILFILLSSIVGPIIAEKNVIISILANDGFLLPAKVLAYRMKMLNMSVPYILMVTENVSERSIGELQSHKITVRRTSLITAAPAKKGIKYQYTRLRLWSMTEYDAIMYLDLDVLPLKDLKPFFKCGSFCAIFRHSDKFNSGVFVLRPNLTVYEDLLAKAPLLPTYDGGDQGFLNSYFDQLKFTPMFDHTHPNEQKYKSEQRTLSAALNYDIGMYYLNGGRFLVDPIIVHYTMGPTKPWIWWTYPLFDLNLYWSNTRKEMEIFYGDTNPDMELIIFVVLVGVCALFFRKLILMGTEDYFRVDALTSSEDRTAHFVIVWISFLLSVNLVPLTAHPFASWIYFITNLNILIVCLSDIFVRIRLGNYTTNYTYPRILASTLISLLILTALSLLALTPTFGTRAILAVVSMISLFFIIPLICKKVLIGCSDYHSRYQLLSLKKEYTH
ncbi:hypothetical protein RB195_021634 [Necator americanus]|uniref:Glycosyltransferase, family 8 n=2 Tax=Necator americanus TaxID=51031 RepID=A0ABR1EBZ2_NECAM